MSPDSTSHLPPSSASPNRSLESEYSAHFSSSNGSAARTKGEIQAQVFASVKDALECWEIGLWTCDDDSIFAAHTSFVDSAIRYGAPHWSIEIWHKLEPLVMEAEKMLSEMEGKGFRIHKGAPYFNVGLCYFLLGDFERAFQYIAEAGVEDEKSGRGPRELVPVGANSLSEQLLIRPLSYELLPRLNASYQLATGSELSATELQTLLNWLSARPIDAYQTISGLHRLRKTLGGPENDVSKQLRVRAVADLVIAVESSIRRWQGVLPGQQLHGRLLTLLQSNAVAHSAFTNFDAAKGQSFPGPAGETTACINWVIEEALSRVQMLPSLSARIGTISFLVAKLRNNLMHSNDAGLNIYNDKDKLLQIVGFVMGTLKLSRFAQEETLGALQ